MGKRILLIILCIIFLLFFKIVYVYDGNILNPADNLRIDKFSIFWSSHCTPGKRKLISSLFIYSRSIYMCPANLLSDTNFVSLSSLRLLLSPVVFLNINTQKQRPMVVYSRLTFDDPNRYQASVSRGLDVLKIMGLDNQSESEPDFRIRMMRDMTSDIALNRFYITFTGEGGMQKIDSLNIKSAPKNGYENGLEISAGTYVARLRDGKHYILIDWRGNNDSPEDPVIWLYIPNSEKNSFNFIYDNDYYYGVTDATHANGIAPHAEYIDFTRIQL